MQSLWGEEFNIDEKKKTKGVLDKIKTPKTPKVSVEKNLKSNKLSIEDKLKLIKDNVEKTLGSYKKQTVIIKSIDELKNYLTTAINNNIIAIDTETNNSLDPVTCKLMGVCIYTPSLDAAYIPINHTTLEGIRLEWQLTENDIFEQFNLLNNTKILTHNGKFDYEVLKCTTNWCMPIYWDTMIGAKVLDENERSAGLKQQYIEKIDPSIEKYSIDSLFENIDYTIVDPELFALYAATDSFMTYKLYSWQLEEFENSNNTKLFNLFKTVEMPLVEVIAEMELAGMEVDQNYAKLLSNKYHKKLEIVDEKIEKELEDLQPKINSWRQTPDANYHPPKANKAGEVGKSKSEQLSDPINLGSPTQLAILFYDILKAPVVNKKAPRGTGEAELKDLFNKLKLPIFNLLIERRGIVKLLTTYVDSIPELAKRWPDGRVRTHFNQYGAATGRLSSSEPLNFQNIPASDKQIRLLFKARDGYRICGGDFSQQEPKITAHYSHDENMINAYLEGKDLYATIASMSFNKPYEECLEFYPEGTEIDYEGEKVICGYKTHQNKEGKQRRSYAKSVLLGVLYGRGSRSVGEQIGKTQEEAQAIIDSFFNAFPKVHRWIEESKKFAYEHGYVEDIAGRRRRLPDILLDKYEVKNLSVSTSFNPLLYSSGQVESENSELVTKYKKLLSEAKYRKDIDDIKLKASNEGLSIKDNSGFIAQAERQAVNARVQGGAATLTKCALNLIYRDERLRKLGAYLINTVHDEILLEAPEDVAEECCNILQEDMINSAKEYIPEVPMKCDTYNVTCWYLDEFFVLVQNEFSHLQEKYSDLEAFEIMCKERIESTRSQLYEIVGNMMKDKPSDYKELEKAIKEGYTI